MDLLPAAARTRFYVKKVLPCMGLIALLLGIFMFGAGIGVLIQEKYHAAVSTVAFQSASIVLLLAGIISFIAGGLEIYVTRFTDSAPPLVGKRSLWFICILSLAAILAFVAAIMGFVYIGKVENKMEDDLTIKLQDYGETFDSLANVDSIQSEDKCCGVNTYADWRDTVYGGHRYDRVPDSCCKEYKYGCGSKFSDEEILNKKGCLEVVKSSIKSHLLLVGIAGILIALIEVGLVIGVCYVRKKHLH
ncbi:CD63 antigen-like [Oculina patagonica]